MRAKEASGTGAATQLHQDEESFRKPIYDAIAACRQAFEKASKKVRGAEARTLAAIDDLNSLKAFIDAVATTMRENSFRDLPGFKRGRERLDGFHQLTVGPWRGVFLVSADGTQVVGLVFSKHPHDLDSRFDEIIDGYSRKGYHAASEG